ncbi:MAG: hypothetical protein EPO01_18640 [Aquabacterium sp.]|nr:MAG: hypothetical protein EPO01_18640 [Aquabacterium sp.]
MSASPPSLPSPPCAARPPKQHLVMSAEIRRLLEAIDRSLADASAAGISDATRFDAAHKAATQCAVVAMLAAGHQAAAPGADHQGSLLQAVSHMLDVGPGIWAELDALRRRRLAADYDGRTVMREATSACIAQAVMLRRRLHAQLAARYPELLGQG